MHSLNNINPRIIELVNAIFINEPKEFLFTLSLSSLSTFVVKAINLFFL